MSTSDFKFKNVPVSFGNKELADLVRGLIGLAWIISTGSLLAAILIPGEDWPWWRIGLFAIFAATATFLNVMNWTSLGDRMSSLFYASQNMRKLADANDLTFFDRRHEHYDSKFYPAIAQLGLRPREEYGCEGIVSGVPTTIYAHSYRSKWINYDIGRTWTLVVRLEMPALMPHTFLQTRDIAKSKVATSVARTFDDNQRVSLQNDLDEYFIFYTHRRTVTDALALWSPSLLFELRQLKCQLSVETIGKYVYIYGNSENDQPENMKLQMEFIEKIAKSFKRSLRVEFLKLPNANKYPFLHSRPAGGLVVYAGKYFAYGWLALGYYTLNSILRLIGEGWTKAENFEGKVFFLIGGFIVSAGFLLYSRSGYTKVKSKRGM